jgi:hypothetical protein
MNALVAERVQGRPFDVEPVQQGSASFLIVFSKEARRS